MKAQALEMANQGEQLGTPRAFESWQRKYPGRLRAIDAGVVVWAVAGAFGVRFGFADTAQIGDGEYVLFSLALIVVWWLMLGYWGTREARILGAGSEEYKRVMAASGWLFGFVAVISYALKIDTARGFVGLAFPAGVIGLLAARWLMRQHLAVDRRNGDSSSKVLIIGTLSSAAHLVRSLRSQPAAGYVPVAVHIPRAEASAGRAIDLGIPVIATERGVDSVLRTVESAGIDAVAISSGAPLGPTDLRQLGWELAARDIGMILVPALTDVAGPRIHTQPVAGLPLIHVSTPKLTGGKRVAKRMFDIFVAGALLILLCPIFIVIAATVRFSSKGPIFYAQERVGLRGTSFHMLKFRSMKANADDELQRLLLEQGSADQPLFKIKNDPRITPVGRILRKYSLDELPQLLNVVEGSMSLVGPRPQRESEVALYDDAAHRRLYVSPGMSGLWQVSGRSNLTWEESIRLDLYYVENWSLMGDVLILIKTFKAVFASAGAV